MAELDQEIAITDTELKVFDTVDSVVSKAITAGDPLPAFSFAEELVRSGQIRGLALAKLLYEMKRNWHIFQAAGLEDNFEDAAFVHTGRAPDTVLKYTRMWENIFANKDIPEGIKKRLMGRDIKDLLLLTAVVREESMTEDKLEMLANAPDANTIRELVKKERGERTSASTALRIMLQLRDGGKYPVGCLYAKQGNEFQIIGSLDVDSDDEMVKKSIARIVNSCGIMEVN